ncbi:MAG: STAS domain-containing protein [Leptospiraceae bacterium]|nr:STAS domain-containing protein [Leptospiraceae bacterium]
MDRPFDLDIRKNCVILTPLISEFNLYVSAAIREQIVGAAAHPVDVLIMKCGKISSIDSAGIGGIIAAQLNIRKEGKELRLIEVPDPILKTIRMLKLENQLRVFFNLQEALNAPMQSP